MRTRIADLVRDAIEIISACDNPDCETWLNQAKAELAVMNAKAQLRQAMAEVERPVRSEEERKQRARDFEAEVRFKETMAAKRQE